MAASKFHITTIIFAVLATVAMTLAALPARAQCTFDAWKPGDGLPGGLDDRVSALTVYNGNLIAGGHFIEASGELTDGVESSEADLSR